MTTQTAQTISAVDAILEENGLPDMWSESEAHAVYEGCPSRFLFDDFEDFMCALIVRGRDYA